MDEQAEYALFRVVINLCKLTNLKAEEVIRMLVAQKALPETYTMADFIEMMVKNANEPLRRGKPVAAHVYVNGKHVFKVVDMRRTKANGDYGNRSRSRLKKINRL